MKERTLKINVLCNLRLLFIRVDDILNMKKLRTKRFYVIFDLKWRNSSLHIKVYSDGDANRGLYFGYPS